MKSKLLLVGVIFTLLASNAAGSTAQTTAPPGDGSFFGNVRDLANAPLPSVKMFAVNVATNARSEARILPTGLYGIPFLPRGTYRIHAELPGAQTVIRVEAIDQGPSKVSLYVTPVTSSPTTGVITGTVRGVDNTSLAKVAITVRSGTGKPQNVMSDDKGTFSIPALDAGVFEIVAEREGFQPLRMGDIHLSGRFTAQVHLKLQPVAGGAAPTAR